MPMTFLTVMHLRTKLIIVLIAVASVVGFLVRIAPAIHHQIYFWFDQGLDTILVKQLVVDHKINLVSRYSGLAGVLMGPLWTWLLAMPFVLSGGSPVANVIFFSILGTFGGLAVYKFLLPISHSAAVFSFLGVLFAPVMIAYSNLVANPHPLSYLFIFYLWFLYRIVIDREIIFWPPLLFLVGLFFQLEIGFALFTIPAILAVIAVFGQWRNLANRYLFLGLLLFGLTFLPQALFDLRHNFLISRGVLALLSGKSSLYGSHDPLLIRFFERAKSFRDDFILMALFIQPTILAAFAFLLSATGWMLAFKKKLRPYLNMFKLLVTVIITFYVGFSFYPGPLWTWYRAGLPVAYVMLLMAGLAIVWEKITQLRPILITLLLIFIVQGINPQRMSDYVAGKPISDNAILQNQEMAIDYVYKNATGRPFSYFAYTPPVYDYVWQYNFWWYGQKKYGYFPKNWQMGVPLLGIGEQSKPPKSDEGLFFLIIEPNYERPWEPDGWRQSYIKYGQVLSTYEFPGKIIVEERVAH